MGNSIELKPCPFCGGKAEIDHLQPYKEISSDKLKHGIAIYCTKCIANMGPLMQKDCDLQYIINSWNDREINNP